MAPPPTISLTTAETDLIPLVAEIALTVIRHRPSNINCFLADYLDQRNRGVILAPRITPDPAIATVLARLHASSSSKETIGDVKNVNFRPVSCCKSREGQQVKLLGERALAVTNTSGPHDVENFETSNISKKDGTKPVVISTPSRANVDRLRSDQSETRIKCKDAVQYLMNEMHTLDNHVTRVKDSITLILKQSEETLKALTTSASGDLVKFKGQFRHDKISKSAINLVTSIQEDEESWGHQLVSRLTGIVTGEVEITEAPFLAAAIGWSLLGVAFLFATAVGPIYHMIPLFNWFY